MRVVSYVLIHTHASTHGLVKRFFFLFYAVHSKSFAEASLVSVAIHWTTNQLAFNGKLKSTDQEGCSATDDGRQIAASKKSVATRFSLRNILNDKLNSLIDRNG